MNLKNLLTSSPGGRSGTITLSILPFDLHGGNHKQNRTLLTLSYRYGRYPAVSIAMLCEKTHHISIHESTVTPSNVHKVLLRPGEKMPISDNSLKSRCEDVFGDSLDPERRSLLIATVENMEKGHPLLRERLSPQTEPAGHAGFLRSLAREK